MEYQAAVHAQGEILARTADTVRLALAELDLAPWRAGALGVVAMGAAYHAAHAFVARLRDAGRRAYPLSATELLAEPVPDLAEAYLAVSQSGRSRETVAAMHAVTGRPRLGITAEPDAPLAAAVDVVVPMGAIEDSPIYSVGYTVTLQAYGLLAGALGIPEGDPGWAALPDMVERALAEARPVAERFAERLGHVPCVDFVGQGPHLAAAAEGALLVREAARLPSACMDTYQYLHGPMEPLEAGLACVAFGDGREVELARAVAKTGATALLITTAAVDEADNLVVFRLPEAEPMQLAVLEIVPIQLLTWELAKHRGLRVEGFRYQQADTKLTREDA